MQHLVIVGDDLQQHFGREVLDVLRLQRHAPLVGGEVDDVVDQAEVAVDEVVPGPLVVMETTLQEGAIYGGKWHV